MLRLGIVSGLLDGTYGGPVSVVRQHARILAGHACVRLFGATDSAEHDEILQEEPAALLFKKSFPRRWCYAPGLRRALDSESPRLDVLHAHMLWDYPVVASAHAAAKHDKPLVVTPHGALLTPERRRAIYKKAYLQFLLKPLLERSTVFHVLTAAEEQGLREAGLRNPVRVIPNGLPQAAFTRCASAEEAYARWPQIKNRRVLLYLGRLWSGKGLDILPLAWANIRKHRAFDDWILVLAGPDYRGFAGQLSDALDAQGLGGSVLLAGALHGHIKDSLLAAAHVFVLPSHGEAFSMSLLEAMAAAVPCLYTSKCSMPDLAKKEGGWECDDTVASLTEALMDSLSSSSDALQAIGLNARQFAARRYSLEIVCGELLAMYAEALGSVKYSKN